MLLHQFLKDNKGLTAIEYGLIAVVLSVSVIGSTDILGIELSNTFDCITRKVNGNAVCIGDRIDRNGEVTTGWGSYVAVNKGDTYEVTLPDNLQHAVRNRARKWFDTATYRGNGRGSIRHSLAAIISEDPISKAFVAERETGNAANFYDFDNGELVKDGKITITAKENGYLSVGILDINGHDNWVTTDGGVTKSRKLPLIVTRVK